jgi:hypothetical protein
MAEVVRRFETDVLPIWERLGIRQAGFWTVAIGESNLDLYYMLRWSSLAERDEKWEQFRKDPEWAARRAESEADGPIIQSISSQLLSPTSYSAAR